MPVLISVMLQVSAPFTAHITELISKDDEDRYETRRLKILFSVIVIILPLLQVARHGKFESTLQE